MSAAVAGLQVDRRVLGGIAFASAITGTSIVDSLVVRNTQLQLRVNRSGIFAILNAPGFTKLNSEFDVVPADWPAISTAFEITVQDPSLRYLGRRAMVQAPQTIASLAAPQKVVLYPGPAGEVEPNWAIVRATVTDTHANGLPWAVLQVLKSDNTVAATGMTDQRGEALLAVPGLGVQVSSGGSGSVTESTLAVTVHAWFDPTVLQQPAGWVPNPDDTLKTLTNPALKTANIASTLAAGQTILAAITISL
ncbi:MAG TPA: hypothetical protein VHZ52_02310 [Acidobacteriaceae bacterium]|jgi:hypothetical protein|nr:hypothetical protein [Acidobacteriaceae bacterium]